MKRATGPEQLLLHRAFSQHLATAFSLLFRESLQHFNNEIREPLGKLTDASQKVLVTALDIMAKTGGDTIEFREAQRRATGYRKLNNELKVMVETIREIAATLDTLADVSPSAIYNYVGRWQRAAASLTTTDIDTAVFPDIPPLVSKLKREVKDEWRLDRASPKRSHSELF